MNAADEFPVGSQWQRQYGIETRPVATVVGTVVMPDGTEWVIFSVPDDSPAPRVYSAEAARRSWGRVVPEPKFKPGDRVTWGGGCDSFVVLASWVHLTTGETYMVTTLDPTNAEWVGGRDGWRLVEDGAA